MTKLGSPVDMFVLFAVVNVWNFDANFGEMHTESCWLMQLEVLKYDVR